MPAPTRRLVSAPAPAQAPAPCPVEEGIPPNEKTYHAKLTTAWPRAPRIEIEIQGAPQAQDVRIPLAFMQSSGENAWSLVHRMLSTLVNEPGQLWDSTDALVDLDAQPKAGQYLFARRVEGDGNGPSFTWRQGPTGSRKDQAADEPDCNDSSGDSACSDDQVH